MKKVNISTYNLYEQFGRKLTYAKIERSHDNEVLKNCDNGFEYFELFNENYDFCLSDDELAYVIDRLTDKVVLQSLETRELFTLTNKEFEIATNTITINS